MELKIKLVFFCQSASISAPNNAGLILRRTRFYFLKPKILYMVFSYPSDNLREIQSNRSMVAEPTRDLGYD